MAVDFVTSVHAMYKHFLTVNHVGTRLRVRRPRPLRRPPRIPFKRRTAVSYRRRRRRIPTCRLCRGRSFLTVIKRRNSCVTYCRDVERRRVAWVLNCCNATGVRTFALSPTVQLPHTDTCPAPPTTIVTDICSELMGYGWLGLRFSVTVRIILQMVSGQGLDGVATLTT